MPQTLGEEDGPYGSDANDVLTSIAGVLSLTQTLLMSMTEWSQFDVSESSNVQRPVLSTSTKGQRVNEGGDEGRLTMVQAL